MSELSVAVVSIARTRRRRFHWAAWWTGAPSAQPFRNPDAHGGGARTHEEALAEARRVASRDLTEIEPRWAQAWSRVMQGGTAFASSKPRAATVAQERSEPTSCWTVLGLTPSATLADIKRAYRQRALETHPDRGGDPLAFRELVRAYERALARRRARPRRG